MNKFLILALLSLAACNEPHGGTIYVPANPNTISDPNNPNSNRTIVYVKGDKGDKGDIGPQGIQGVNGTDNHVVKRLNCSLLHSSRLGTNFTYNTSTTSYGDQFVSACVYYYDYSSGNGVNAVQCYSNLIPKAEAYLTCGCTTESETGFCSCGGISFTLNTETSQTQGTWTIMGDVNTTIPHIRFYAPGDPHGVYVGVFDPGNCQAKSY